MRYKMKKRRRRELETILRSRDYSEGDIRDILRHATGWRTEDGYLIIETR
jgi:hypothetical protein